MKITFTHDQRAALETHAPKVLWLENRDLKSEHPADLRRAENEMRAGRKQARALVDKITARTTEAEARKIEAEFDALMDALEAGRDATRDALSEGGRYQESPAGKETITEDDTRRERVLSYLPSGDARRGDAQGPIFRNLSTGKEVRAYRPEDSLSEHRGGPTFGQFVASALSGDWSKILEARDMSVGVDAAGGFVVPSPLSTQFIDLARNRSSVLQAGALTMPMESKTLDLARNVGDPTGEWKVENAAITASDMTLDKVTLDAKVLVAMVKLSVELAEDGRNVAEVVENALADALALEFDRAALVGSGTGEEPTGITNQTGIQTIAHDAALNNYDVFSSASQKVSEANGTSSVCIINPRDAGALDRLADTTGQPLRPPESWQSLRKIASNQAPIDGGVGSDEGLAVVGDFSKCILGIRTDVRIEATRTGGDSFGKLQTWIRAYLRVDVALSQPTHFCTITGINP